MGNRSSAGVQAPQAATLPKGHPTQADLDAIARENYAAETARRAEELARVQEERERTLNQRNNGRAYICQVAQDHPIQPGEPVVRICWSEHPAFYSWEEDTLTLSVPAAEIILSHYDREAAQDEERGYYKTKFLIEYTGRDGQPHTYEGRYDLGDNDGGLVEHIRRFGQSLLDLGPYGNGIHREEVKEEAQAVLDFADLLHPLTPDGQADKVVWAPWLLEGSRRKTKEIRDLLDAVAMLTDDQVEAAVFSIPADDARRAEVARFFLQELFRRDQPRALDVFRRWNQAAG